MIKILTTQSTNANDDEDKVDDDDDDDCGVDDARLQRPQGVKLYPQHLRPLGISD